MKKGDTVGLIDITGVVTSMEEVVDYNTLVHITWYTTLYDVVTYCNYWIETEKARATNDAPTCVVCTCSTRTRPWFL